MPPFKNEMYLSSTYLCPYEYNNYNYREICVHNMAIPTGQTYVNVTQVHSGRVVTTIQWKHIYTLRVEMYRHY